MSDSGIAYQKAAISLPLARACWRRLLLIFPWILPLFLTPPDQAYAQGVCDRTPQVRDKLMEITAISSCEKVTAARLRTVRHLDLSNQNPSINALKLGDFSGLTSLEYLYLDRNSLTTLPDSIFSRLSSLKDLNLRGNSLTILPQDIFSGLTSLEYLGLGGNSLTTLPEDPFSGLTSLEDLGLGGNSLTTLPEDIFSGLTSLEYLELGGNSLITLPQDIFSGLTSLRHLNLRGNILTTLPEDIFSGLPSLEYLGLGGSSLTALPPRIFRDLTTLVSLNLSNGSLSSLPEGVFQGLTSLTRLSLAQNALSTLPNGIFRNLDSLTWLSLITNPMRSLPAGVFDDVLDTLEELRSAFRGGLAFTSTAQFGLAGTTVRAEVTLGLSLPVAVHVPFTVSGTATREDYEGLSPRPETGLLFLAGETTKEIVLTLSQKPRGLGKTIELILGSPSEIGLRRSDGTGPDAPHLRTDALVYRPFESGVHTVTIYTPEDSAGICNRTAQVRDALVAAIPEALACGQVTWNHLAGVTRLNLSNSGLSTLQAHDFAGLNSLRVLWLHNNPLYTNPLTGLRPGIFDDALDTLEDLRVDPHLRVTVSFWSRKQKTAEGYRVRVGVSLTIVGHERNFSRLPVAVRVPYTVGGTVPTDDIMGLPAPSERNLVFPANAGIREINFTVSEESGNQGKTVEFRLGQLSQLGLLRSDGTGPNAAYLKAASLVQMHTEKAVHTVTVVDAVPADVCDRTPQVRDALVERIKGFSDDRVSACSDITMAHLSSVPSLWLAGADISALQANDFDGMTSLKTLLLGSNSLSELPEGIFSELSNLEWLTLGANNLSQLPEEVFGSLTDLTFLDLSHNNLSSLSEGIFGRLNNLRDLDLTSNSLTSLAERSFQGLSNLRMLCLAYNDLNTLPAGIFQGLTSLERLFLTATSLSELPETVFQGLNSLELLWLVGNSLGTLHPNTFRGLSSLKFLYLSRNSLTELPEEVFRGLSSLKHLTLWSNQLSGLPEGLFRGLRNLEWLLLYNNFLRELPRDIFAGLHSLEELSLDKNSLDELPVGIFDDVLDTLRRPSYTRLALRLDAELKATVGFASNAQKTVEGAAVKVPVRLSRALPVAVRVPYSLGFSGAASGGMTGLSPPPHRGLLFLAGDTRREISYNVAKDNLTQGDRTLVFTLGKPSEIGLRRSSGLGPDAPYLRTESLLLRSDEESTHTVTVSDTDASDQDPFCLSLWEGSPCSTASTLPHVFMGPLGESQATTVVIVTNRDPQPADCEVALLFHQGTAPGPAVSFNGRFLDQNLLLTTIPRGGAEILTLTAPDATELTVGALYAFTRSPCTADSLQVQGRYLVENQTDGEIEELFSLPGQSEIDWLGNGDCRRLTGIFGDTRSVALATVTSQPGQAAPPGTRLHFREFDLKGKFIQPLPGLEISGRQQALSPWDFRQPTILEMCLDTAGTHPFQLAVTAIGSAATGERVQFAPDSFPKSPNPEDGDPVP